MKTWSKGSARAAATKCNAQRNAVVIWDEIALRRSRAGTAQVTAAVCGLLANPVASRLA